MLASLVSALTLVPLFFWIFRPREKKELKINSLLDRIKGKYEKMERKLLYRKKLSMAVAVLLLVAAFALVGLMKVELMPSIDEGTVSVAATFRSGTKVSEVDARMQELEAMVARVQMAQTMKYSLIVVASVPMLIIYPFVQKFFVKGVMIGSVKG